MIDDVNDGIVVFGILNGTVVKTSLGTFYFASPKDLEEFNEIVKGDARNDMECFNETVAELGPVLHLLHRDGDKPAMELENGHKEWRVKGEFKRDNPEDPVIITCDGKEYYLNDFKIESHKEPVKTLNHCVNPIEVTTQNGNKVEYFLHGTKVSIDFPMFGTFFTVEDIHQVVNFHKGKHDLNHKNGQYYHTRFVEQFGQLDDDFLYSEDYNCEFDCYNREYGVYSLDYNDFFPLTQDRYNENMTEFFQTFIVEDLDTQRLVDDFIDVYKFYKSEADKQLQQITKPVVDLSPDLYPKLNVDKFTEEYLHRISFMDHRYGVGEINLSDPPNIHQYVDGDKPFKVKGASDSWVENAAIANILGLYDDLKSIPKVRIVATSGVDFITEYIPDIEHAYFKDNQFLVWCYSYFEDWERMECEVAKGFTTYDEAVKFLLSLRSERENTDTYLDKIDHAGMWL